MALLLAMLGELRKQIPGNGKRLLRHNKAYNGDLRKQIESDFELAKSQTKNMASRFLGSDRRSTANKVHSFIRRNVVYLRDDPKVQQIKLPSRLLRDLTGDCKSVSLFAAAILANLGFPVSFKYASYDAKQPTPSHIYVATQDENGKEIIVDGTCPVFDHEKPPKHSFYKDLNMRVETLSDEVLANEFYSAIELNDEVLAGRKGGKLFQRLKQMGKKKRSKFFQVINPMKQAQMVKGLIKIGKKIKARRKKKRGIHDEYEDFDVYEGVLDEEVLADQILAGHDEVLSAEAGKVFYGKMKKMNPVQRKAFLGQFTPMNRKKLMQSIRTTAKMRKMNCGTIDKGVKMQGIHIEADPYDPFTPTDDVVEISGKKLKKKRAAKKQKKLAKAKPGSRKARVLKRKVEKLTIKSTKSGKEKKEALKTFRKNRRGEIKEAAKKVTKVLAKIDPVLGLGRGAFLALLRLNMRGMASKFADIRAAGKAGELYKKWGNLGGKKSRLDKAIDKGKGKKWLMDRKHNKAAKKGKGVNDEYLAVEPVSTSAGVTTAAASTILAALVPIMKKLFEKMGKKKDADELDGVVEDAQNDAKLPRVQNFISKVKDVLQKPGVKKITDAGVDALDNFIQDKFLENDGEPTSADDGDEEGEGLDNKTLLIGAGVLGALGLAFAMKK